MDTTTFEILSSVRLTGAIFDDGLQIMTKRRRTECIHDDLLIRSDQRNIEMQCHDFVDSSGRSWEFVECNGWRRGDDKGVGNYARKILEGYTDGTVGTPIDIVARPRGSTAAADEKPKRIYVKIEPIIDGPDRT